MCKTLLKILIGKIIARSFFIPLISSSFSIKKYKANINPKKKDIIPPNTDDAME